ncbi:centrosomal protein of 41 kDa B-like isoform X2 [Physella acuta]|nr:centrosomal protein of 41 kDa B-like isoform X2 [Physella acuta]
MEKMEELKRNYNFRKDEIFKRMKISTFVQLVVQVADVDNFEEGPPYSTSGTDRPDTADNEVERIQKNGSGDTSRQTSDTSRQTPEVDTSRSRLEQVINGMGEVDLDASKRPHQPLPMMGSQCPYLLLDVREKDAFDECHIITAKSYPTAMLARSVNYETKDMLNYKNQPGKIILIYDEDERISHRAATTLVQRGYDNLFMLSGGMKVAYKLFPEGLIAGTVPQTILDDTPQGQKGSKHKTEPLMKLPANTESFSLELIEKLCVHLDDTASDRSGASRLSKLSSAKSSRPSSIASTASLSTLGRKPFKC